MGTPETSLEDLNHLHELSRAWQNLYRTAEDPSLGLAAHQAAAIQALDLHAENLGVLNKCRHQYGGFSDVGDVFQDIEEWATFDPADKARRWDEFALHMERPAVHEGGPVDCHSWGEQLDHWIGQCAGEDADPAAAKHGRCQPLTPDATVCKRIAQWLWSFIKAGYGFTVEKVAKGTTDSITKRP